MHWTRIAGATIFAAVIGFLIHVMYGQGIALDYVQKAAESGRLNDVIRQPYPNWVVAIASLTALIPAFGKVFVEPLTGQIDPDANSAALYLHRLFAAFTAAAPP